VATRPAPGKTRPPVISTRPAPAATSAPAPKPPVPKAPTVPTARSNTNQPPTKTKPPKPTSNPGPGRSWVFNSKTNSWEAKAKSITVSNRPTTSTYVPGQGTVPTAPTVGGGDADGSDGVEPPVSSKTQAEIDADIRKAAETAVGMYDPTLEGKWTSETTGLGGLGFGYTKADGSRATYADIFGSTAPGSSVDRSAFQVRDALGRVIDKDILGTDVYGGAAATDIAGTALGNEILGARRSAARDAEARSAGGMMGGGLRDAAGEFQNQERGAAITGLLGKLAGLEGDITGERTRRYQGALEDASKGDIGRWAPESSEVPKTPSTTSTTPVAGKVDLTPGPKGTFVKEVDAARASGTPKQKIQKLTALLRNTKYNMSALQKKTIQQMITDIQKKNK
jgi:hypothetical protein